jgi:hypothetical protein
MEKSVNGMIMIHLAIHYPKVPIPAEVGIFFLTDRVYKEIPPGLDSGSAGMTCVCIGCCQINNTTSFGNKLTLSISNLPQYIKEKLPIRIIFPNTFCLIGKGF